MSEYEQGMNIFVRLPAEVQRIVKQKLLDGFWVAIKTHRPCELLDDRPFCWAHNCRTILLRGYRFNFSKQDRRRLYQMSQDTYVQEIVPPHDW